jgi:hypothetical protein
MAMLTEWKSKPKNGYLYLLSEQGDKSKLREPRENWVADNITFGSLVVYNTETDRVSTKSIYINKNGRFYVKGGRNSTEKRMCYLDEFE